MFIPTNAVGSHTLNGNLSTGALPLASGGSTSAVLWRAFSTLLCQSSDPTDGPLALRGGTHPAVVNMGYGPASSTESVSLHERQLFTLDCAILCDPQNGGH